MITLLRSAAAELHVTSTEEVKFSRTSFTVDIYAVCACGWRKQAVTRQGAVELGSMHRYGQGGPIK